MNKIMFLCIIVSLFLTCESYSNDVRNSNIYFTTEGSTFTPLIKVKSGGTVLWTFSDGTTSDSVNPSIDFGTTARRIQTLKVTPWDAVTAIDLGYDGGDGGTLDDSYKIDNCNVSSIKNLSLVSNNLVIFCASHNPLTSIHLKNFSNLQTLELYYCTRLTSADVRGCSSLKRICLERCQLKELNLADCTAMEDLRGAGNKYTYIHWPSSAPNMWHMCLVENPQFIVNPPFQDAENFPSLREIWISGSNIQGDITISQQNISSIWLSGNSIKSLDLSAATFPKLTSYLQCWSCRLSQLTLGSGSALLYSIEAYNCDLTSLDISMLTNIHKLDLHNNKLTSSAVDDILEHLDTLTDFTGTVNLSGVGNAVPGSNGISHANNLMRKGWTVIYNNVK